MLFSDGRDGRTPSVSVSVIRSSTTSQLLTSHLASNKSFIYIYTQLSGIYGFGLVWRRQCLFSPGHRSATTEHAGASLEGKVTAGTPLGASERIKTASLEERMKTASLEGFLAMLSSKLD